MHHAPVKRDVSLNSTQRFLNVVRLRQDVLAVTAPYPWLMVVWNTRRELVPLSSKSLTQFFKRSPYNDFFVITEVFFRKTAQSVTRFVDGNSPLHCIIISSWTIHMFQDDIMFRRRSAGMLKYLLHGPAVVFAINCIVCCLDSFICGREGIGNPDSVGKDMCLVFQLSFGPQKSRSP